MDKDNKDNRDKSISTNRVDATESGINTSSIGISNESPKTAKKCNKKIIFKKKSRYQYSNINIIKKNI